MGHTLDALAVQVLQFRLGILCSGIFFTQTKITQNPAPTGGTQQRCFLYHCATRCLCSFDRAVLGGGRSVGERWDASCTSQVVGIANKWVVFSTCFLRRVVRVTCHRCGIVFVSCELFQGATWFCSVGQAEGI